MPAHRTSGIGLKSQCVQYNSGCLCCKIAQNLILHALSLLSLPSIKNLPVPVPAERRMAFNASRAVVEREDEEDEDEEDEEEDNYMEGLGL